MKNINLRNSLIYEIIQLFAVMASADGEITVEEKNFAKSYFNTLYPESFAQVLFEEFEDAVQSGINTDKILSSINRRLSNDDKIFLIVKLIELMITDEVHESERKILNIISEKFKIPDENVNFLISLISGSNIEDQFASEEPYKFLTITDDQQDGNVLLAFPGLKLVVLNIGKRLIVFQHDSTYRILVNEKPIVKHFASLVPKNANIQINNRYDLSYQDLIFYFKNLNAPKSLFYLEETNKDIEICLTKPETDLVICERIGCRIYLTPQQKNNLLINGQWTDKRTVVNFGDRIFWNNYRINLRTLVFQSFFQVSEETKLSSGNIRKFTIGNNLESTISIDDELDRLWDCQIELEYKSYYIDVKKCPHHVFVNDTKVTKRTKLNISDNIRILNSIISYNIAKRVFEKKEFGINIFETKGIKYQFNDKTYGINDVSFTAKRGELIGIMGTSGCGKTTLLNILNGYYKPQEGSVLADGYDIHENIELLSSYMSYVPQDDLLYDNLTVFENLYYNAKLRFPGRGRNHRAIVDRVLHDIGMYDKRNVRVGDLLHKVLSGGERKRVNIGLELLADSNIILLDEPTSGLSSKDSERILKLLQSLSFQGKIIYVVIHQPSVRLYELFNKLVLLDKGGKLAYFGSPLSAIEYFRKYSVNTENSEAENLAVDPDFLLDTIEEQISDIDGTALPVRKHSPDFWQQEFKNHLKEIPRKEKKEDLDTSLIRKQKTISDHLSISKTLLQRNFVNKLRDKSNLIITFLLPPFLGLFVGTILHYTPGNEYTFFENKHVGTFLFLSMLIAIFLGITNSVEEIIKDQNVLNREKMLKISNLSYLNSKILTLIPFAFIQNLLFIYMGYFILEGKEFYLEFTLLLTVISFCGISIGLFISSIPGLSSKAAINIIPVILIPQIVFGGALIQYQEMNKQLVFSANSPIPEICQIMPSRWGFESLVTYLGYNNSFRIKDEMEKELTAVNNKIKKTEDDTYLDTLLEERKMIRAKIDTVKMLYHDTHGNLDISQAIKIDGNLEYKNFVAGKTSVYPMFIGEKTLPLIHKEVSTPLYNSVIIVIMSLIVNLLTLLVLKIRFRWI